MSKKKKVFVPVDFITSERYYQNKSTVDANITDIEDYNIEKWFKKKDNVFYLMKILYNEYGRVLERISYSEELTDSNRVVYTYEDGWRLILEEQYSGNSTDITQTTEYQWEDNKKIYIEDINEGATSKWSSVETYNYYWKLIKRENFSYYLNDNNEWKLEHRNALFIEYECPGFEQIYP